MGNPVCTGRELHWERTAYLIIYNLDYTTAIYYILSPKLKCTQIVDCNLLEKGQDLSFKKSFKKSSFLKLCC